VSSQASITGLKCLTLVPYGAGEWPRVSPSLTEVVRRAAKHLKRSREQLIPGPGSRRNDIRVEAGDWAAKHPIEASRRPS